MTTIGDFKRRTKMRHDFSDQIQVRYQHPDGQFIDTWVSGDEVLTRLHSEAVEEDLRSIKSLNWNNILDIMEELPEKGQEYIERQFRVKLADEVDDVIGDNLLGDGFVEAIKGDASDQVPSEPDKSKWKSLLQMVPFREKVIELAWIQLEGSLPESQSGEEFDDWA
jgi:hypothetical protein